MEFLIPPVQVLQIRLAGAEPQRGGIDVDQVDTPAWGGQRREVGDNGSLPPAVVCEHMTAHDHVEPARLQAGSVSLADLSPALPQAGDLPPGQGYRPGISIDADRLSLRAGPFRQQPEHGARATSHIGYPGTGHDARRQPLRRLA